MCQGWEVGIWNWGHKEAGGRDSKISVTRSEAGGGKVSMVGFFSFVN